MRSDLRLAQHYPGVTAKAAIRKMRGGAQAHLVAADDGHFYVVKFSNNPQHQRLLVNELMASVLLCHLGVATPEWAFVTVSEEFLGSNPDVRFDLAHGCRPVAAGVHFGSRYPGHPAHQTVYDFLPESLLANVSNIHDFLGVLAFDKWTCNIDSRQAIFFRNDDPRRRDRSFIVQMIDNGSAFGGADWKFYDSSLYGGYFCGTVYRGSLESNSFQPWLDQIIAFSESSLVDASRIIPDEWLNGDRNQLDQLLFQLLKRRKQLPRLLHETQTVIAG